MVTPISKEDIERMKQSDVLTELMLEFCEYFPSLSRVLLLERDLYLARSIVGISMNADTGDRVVAVVGLGHLKGMQEALERWKKNPELIQEECKDLTFVPPTPFTGRRMALLFVLIAILIGVLVFFGARQVIRWIF
jgi:pheromone shutdown protein TraB